MKRLHIWDNASRRNGVIMSVFIMKGLFQLGTAVLSADSRDRNEHEGLRSAPVSRHSLPAALGKLHPPCQLLTAGKGGGGGSREKVAP